MKEKGFKLYISSYVHNYEAGRASNMQFYTVPWLPFYRVTTKDLLGTFRAALDKYSPLLLKLYRARKAAFGQDMDNLLEKLDKQTSNIELHRRSTSLEGLPIFVRENSKKLFLTCLVTDPEDGQTKGVKMGILTVLDDDDSTHTLLCPQWSILPLCWKRPLPLQIFQTTLLRLPTFLASSMP
ncbi:hypothetical protein NFI96_026135 [Prochilodus magdalenae]|nr:hypothetical protein NFI96_026135 [Prochilodus magdalenae]